MEEKANDTLAAVTEFLSRDLFVVNGAHVTAGVVIVLLLALYLWRSR